MSLITEFLLSRPTVIGFAITGGLISMVARWCQVKSALSERGIAHLNKASYIFMVISIVLFIGAGFFGIKE